MASFFTSTTAAPPAPTLGLSPTYGVTAPASAPAPKSAKVLSSDWTGLNPNLLARIVPVKRDPQGSGWVQSMDVRALTPTYSIDDGFEVHGPITDGNSEISQNWNSPFEGAGAESKAPTLSALLQSGTADVDVSAFLATLGGNAAITSALQSVQGRTGITKLNSTQVFSGMPPVKVSFTMHFRAMKDPQSEVTAPLIQLKQWSVPQLLASDGFIAGALTTGTSTSILEKIFPSVSPQIVSFAYGDLTYSPMVIENISDPITAPRDSSGALVSVSVQITMATLTAIDGRDIKALYRQ